MITKIKIKMNFFTLLRFIKVVHQKCMYTSNRHFFYLGCMKTLLKLWLGKGPAYLRLSAQDIHEISLAMIGMRTHWPFDFARKPRGFKVFTLFKNLNFV